MPPIVVVESLGTLLYIRKVPGSNPGPETGYPDYGFCGFPQSPQLNTGIVPQIRPLLQYCSSVFTQQFINKYIFTSVHCLSMSRISLIKYIK